MANPFYIGNFEPLKATDPLVYQAMSTIPFFTSPFIRKGKLLRPYPHMNGLNQMRVPDGAAKAHSLELVFQRRMSKGMMAQVNYTALRQRDRVEVERGEIEEQARLETRHPAVAAGEEVRLEELQLHRRRRLRPPAPGQCRAADLYAPKPWTPASTPRMTTVASDVRQLFPNSPDLRG